MVSIRTKIALLLAAATFVAPAHAAERVTLRGGAQFDCSSREPDGDHVKLYLLPAVGVAARTLNYIEVPASAVLTVEAIPDPPVTATVDVRPSRAPLTAAELHEILSSAGALHNVDADLLASVVKAESNGNVHAVSRAGAQGLMQLMPGTAANLGVHDSFVPEQNVSGGTAYLDQLLKRYNDNIALALAAYNAGPLAVDHYRGIPPYRETRAYVARVIREFNRRKLLASVNQTVNSAVH